ncbi:MexH family multidrug efflux RND transporter periplasmic adaptor subunit [Geothrix limicola]|uniref:MexH family multidrug efflux RND transporter periplasmic adaptor subunit n=1 Tax=Geothrix limicola TaxID=2927978 RepID=A0ABQ5QHT5_9BACT|nr:efflux RND transporter periplasmic adaptor subunit [Geothrix limicola]GLH74147.1 MexH family multidrug efflux RND transporter periplasmic adaptor subunit [Geothrix limicola]
MDLEHAQSEADVPAPSTRKRMILMILAVGLFLGLLVGFNVFKGIMIGRSMAGGGEPPQVVSAAPAKEEAWQPALRAVGTIRARQGADLAFEVAGVVVSIDAKAGSEVRAGQPLVSLNDDTEAGQLRQLQAAAALAKATLRRAKEQFEAKTISPADFESAEADFKAKEAAVQAQTAVVAKKHLVAPFAGRVGIVNTSPGAYLNPGTPVLTLQQLDQVYLDFFLPQRDVVNVRLGQRVDASLDAFPGRTFSGKVSAVNPKVEGNTRNVQVEATFANPGRLLVPGMFVNATLDVGTRQMHLTLPQAAVTYNPYGAIVFVVKGDKASGSKAQQVFVTTGESRGDQVAILKGLKAGDLVVTSGSLKLRNGTPVVVDNKVQPANDPAPTPQEQ